MTPRPFQLHELSNLLAALMHVLETGFDGDEATSSAQILEAMAAQNQAAISGAASASPWDARTITDQAMRQRGDVRAAMMFIERARQCLRSDTHDAATVETVEFLLASYILLRQEGEGGSDLRAKRLYAAGRVGVTH